MTLRRDASGAVMVETLLAFLPLLMLFLGIVQQVLLAAAQLVVHHAAFVGARSASVVLDDDPARYNGAKRLDIQDEARVAPIRDAVHARLAAIVPPRALAALAGAPGSSVLDALGRAPAERLAQAPLYLPAVTAITFPRAPGSEALFEERVEPVDTITVRVTHLATCTIPLVAKIMCSALEDTEVGELERAPAASMLSALARSGIRGVVLQAEANMPLQDAPYRYASQPEEP